jgi:hypothetical protein
MIANTNSSDDTLSDIMRDLKKFRSKAIIDFKQTGAESRRHWLLKLFTRGENNFQVWQ